MIRLFDPLRRSVREDASKTSAERAEDNNPEQELQPSPASRPEGFEGLESIRCHVGPEDRIVGCSQNHNFGAEKFRFLCHRLNELRQHKSLSRVLVTSAIPKEGKTVVAVNLALSLARSSPRVALVDADMRQPGVHRALGLGALPGLGEFLEGNLDLAVLVRRVDPFGLYLLPAGHASSNPFELLQGPRMRELMKQIAPAFDWIVFDSPPLISFADSHCLATLTDTVLLVVRPGLTPRETVQQGLAALEGAYVAGVVLNASDDARQDRYYYHYYPAASAKGKAPIATPPTEEGTPGNG